MERASRMEQNKLTILMGHGALFRDIRVFKNDGKWLTRTFMLHLKWYLLGLKSREKKTQQSA